jgi:hypothetical protein
MVIQPSEGAPQSVQWEDVQQAEGQGKLRERTRRGRGSGRVRGSKLDSTGSGSEVFECWERLKRSLFKDASEGNRQHCVLCCQPESAANVNELELLPPYRSLALSHHLLHDQHRTLSL